MKLPMRFRIIHIISQHDTMNDQEVMNALRDEYSDEGQYTFSKINTHLMSLRAVGIIDNAGVSLDNNDKLIQQFKITDYGKQLLNSYLPKQWKN